MSVTPQYQDRYEGGRALAAKLTRFAGKSDVAVLGLAYGGMPAAYEVAQALGAPLDILVLRQLLAPGYEEMPMGLASSGHAHELYGEVIRRLRLPEDLVERIARETEEELDRQASDFRNGRDPVEINGRTVLVVDDGLATGACMRGALALLRSRGAGKVIAAVAAASADGCAGLRDSADDVVCALSPEPFYSIGAWYADFMPVPEGEIKELLDRNRRAFGVGGARRTATDKVMRN